MAALHSKCFSSRWPLKKNRWLSPSLASGRNVADVEKAATILQLVHEDVSCMHYSCGLCSLLNTTLYLSEVRYCGSGICGGHGSQFGSAHLTSRKLQGQQAAGIGAELATAVRWVDAPGCLCGCCSSGYVMFCRVLCLIALNHEALSPLQIRSCSHASQMSIVNFMTTLLGNTCPGDFSLALLPALPQCQWTQEVRSAKSIRAVQ